MRLVAGFVCKTETHIGVTLANAHASCSHCSKAKSVHLIS